MLRVEETWGCAPDVECILSTAKDSLKRLQPFFPASCGQVSLRVEEIADEEVLEALFLENPYELMGVYSGISSSLELHDIELDAKIWLFRLPLLKCWIETGDMVLETLVANVMLTEIGAHYRWSEELLKDIFLKAELPQIQLQTHD